MTVNPRMPVLVGVAQQVDRDSPPETAPTPLDRLERVARLAAADCGVGDALWPLLDRLAVIRAFADSAKAFAPPFWGYTNLPLSLSRRLGAVPARLLYPHAGGNTPQWLVNDMSAAIARGEMEIGLIAGVEAIRTQTRALKAGIALDWSDAPDGPAAEEIGDARMGVSRHELGHGIALPVNVYPLFENALAAHYGRHPVAHRQALGALMAPFTQVAAANPFSALPTARGARELAEPGPDNRYIAYPYTKYLNSNMFVDQAAALLVMSTARADALGVPPHKRIYLHGCADTTEKYLVSERVDYWSSPAIRIGGHHALAHAGRTVGDLALMDIYSCFPVAVEVAADELGIAHDDPRGLTVTGGLPYFGGPGNNYVTHSIAQMALRLRERPGAFGLVTANGMYLTKHSFGVYSTTPVAGAWTRADPAVYQREIDALPSPAFTETPEGAGAIETFTVVYGKEAPQYAIIIGRLTGSGERFLAVMADQLDRLIDQPAIGRGITVTPGSPANLARLAAGS